MFAATSVPRGIATICLSAALFSVMNALIKVTDELHVAQIIFFRNAIGFIPLLPLLWQAGPEALKTKRPWGHLGRSLAGLAAMALIFWSFTALPLADVVAILFGMPIFVTALSVPLLKEAVGWRRWTAVAVGFVGLLFMVRPSGGAGFDLLYLAPLVAAVFYALAVIAIRQLSAHGEPSVATAFYFTLTCTIASGLVLPFVWISPTGWQWLCLIGIGLIGGTAQFLLVDSFRHAPAVVIAPFDYTQMIWAVLLGAIFFNELPTWMTLIGAAIVVGSGLYILIRESRDARACAPLPVGAPGPQSGAAYQREEQNGTGG